MRTASLVLSGLLLACAGSSLVAWRILTGWFQAPKSPNAPDKVVWVKDVSPEQVSKLLDENGLVSRRDWLELYLRTFRSKERRMRPGEYNLSAKLSPAELISTLESGDVVTYSIAFGSGLTAREITKLFTDKKLVEEAEIQALIEDRRFLQELQIEARSLEGFLFPGAYHLSRGTPARDLLEQMVAEYRSKVGETLILAARNQGLTETDLITLASVIEKEPVPSRQWPELSAVLHNRLKRHLPLRCRSTLAYGLQKEAKDLTPQDFASDNAHNTHRRIGLPPTPVSNPGLDAIGAAAYPATSDALFFGGPRPDGSWVFCPDEGCLEALLGPSVVIDPSPPLIKALPTAAEDAPPSKKKEKAEAPTKKKGKKKKAGKPKKKKEAAKG